MKKCTKCFLIKNLDAFGKRSNSPDGLHTHCKSCRAKYSRQWNKENNTKVRSMQRKRYRERRIVETCLKCPAPTLPDKDVCELHYYARVAYKALGCGNEKYAKLLRQKMVDQNHLCPYTGKELILGRNCSINHIKPKSRFPELANDIDNIEWVLTSINRQKHTKTKEEFQKIYL